MLPNCNVEFKNCGRPVIINGVDVFVPYDIFEYFEGGEIELMFTQNCTMQKNLFFATIIFDKLPNKNLRGNDASFVGT